MWLSHNHNTSTWGWQEHPQPGVAWASYCISGQRPVFWLWDSCMSRDEYGGRGGLSMSWECLCQEPCVDFPAGKAQKHVLFRIAEIWRLRNASKNNCMFFPCLCYGLLWKWNLKYCLLLLWAQIWGKKPTCGHFYRAFQMNTSVCFVFSVIANKI